MILLFVVLSNQEGPDLPADLLLRDSERCLEVFKTMDVVSVARKCAEITQEVLEVARQSVVARQRPRPRSVPPEDVSGPQAAAYSLSSATESASFLPPSFQTGMTQETGALNLDDDLYAGLIDINVIGNYLDFGSGSLWPNDVGVHR